MYNYSQRLFALIIGINEYDHVAKLRGCVSDANEVEEFLKFDLMVPPDHIISLRDQSATRAKIMQAFRDLATDPRIKKDDPIFIFYAGHGTELVAPRGWEAGGPGAKIQALMPQDYNTYKRDAIHAIPDRTVGALINSIARAKGNNVVSSHLPTNS